MTATKKQTAKKSRKTADQPATEASIAPILEHSELANAKAMVTPQRKKKPAKSKARRRGGAQPWRLTHRRARERRRSK